MLEAIRESGVEVESSCEQDVCGSCMTAVIDGEPEHLDQCLTDGKSAGKLILPCVSRTRTNRLVLDL